MSSKLRCAVVGLGMGRNHAKTYAALAESELVAVADLDPKRLEEWAPTIGASKCYTDYKRMLKEARPDLVSVALPNFLHAPVTIDCLKAGAHVQSEKPMALNVAQARKMRDEARKRKRVLGINLSYRFTAAAQSLKALADDGFLGTPYHGVTRWTRRDGFPKFGSWFGQKKLSGGGPLIDLGVHRIDLALWLMGNPEPVSVSAAAHDLLAREKAKRLKAQYDCEDLAGGFIRFKNGASLLFEISWGAHQNDPESMNTTVLGTDGSLVHRNEGGGYQFVAEFHTTRAGQKLSGQIPVQKGFEGQSSQADLVQAIVHGKRPLADAEDGLRMQYILDAIYKSAATGREVRIAR